MSMKRWRLFTHPDAKFWCICHLWHQICLLRPSLHIGETPGHCGLGRRTRCSLSSCHEQHTQCQSHQGPQGQSHRRSLLGCSGCSWTGCCGLSAHMPGPGRAQGEQSPWLLPGTAEQISVGQSPGLSETNIENQSLRIPGWKGILVKLPACCRSPLHSIFESRRRLCLLVYAHIQLTNLCSWA